MNSVPRTTPLRDRQEVKRQVLAAQRQAALEKLCGFLVPQVAEEKEDLTANKRPPVADDAIDLVLVDITQLTSGEYIYSAHAYCYPVASDVETEVLSGTFDSLGDACVWGSNIARGRKARCLKIEADWLH